MEGLCQFGYEIDEIMCVWHPMKTETHSYLLVETQSLENRFLPRVDGTTFMPRMHVLGPTEY